MALKIRALLEGTLPACLVVSVIHSGLSITAATLNHHPEIVLAFASGFSGSTVPWEKLEAWLWHSQDSSPFPLSPASRELLQELPSSHAAKNL